MQVVLDMASQWTEEATMKISSTKTKAMIITRKRHFTKPPRLKLNGVELKYCQQVLYLGLWVDHKLTWKYHLATVGLALTVICCVRYYGQNPGYKS